MSIRSDGRIQQREVQGEAIAEIRAPEIQPGSDDPDFVEDGEPVGPGQSIGNAPVALDVRPLRVIDENRPP